MEALYYGLDEENRPVASIETFNNCSTVIITSERVQEILDSPWILEKESPYKEILAKKLKDTLKNNSK